MCASSIQLAKVSVAVLFAVAPLAAAVDSVPIDEGLVLVCPPDIQVSCMASTDPAQTGRPTVTTDCYFAEIIDDGGRIDDEPYFLEFADSIEPGECEGSVTILRVWSAYDDCESFAVCTQRIEVVNNLLPEIVCQLPSFLSVPSTLVVDEQTCFGQVPDFRPQAMASHACSDVLEVLQVPAPGSFFTNSVVVVLRAEDDCGNSSEATCELIVECTIEEVCRIRGTICLLPADAELPGIDGEEGFRCTEQAGVTVRLIQLPASNLVQQVSTDQGGVFEFAVLPAGEYLVQVDESTLPQGAVRLPLGHDPDQALFYDPMATFCPDLDFIYQQTLSLCGVVWFDQNGNGLPDEDLLVSGLNGVSVRLVPITSGGATDTSVTGPGVCLPIQPGPMSGSFGFQDLAQGSYLLEVDPLDVSLALINLLNSMSLTVPPGFVMTTPQSYEVVCGPLGCEVFNSATGQPAAPHFGMRYEPTAIDLASFAAIREENGVLLRWSTAMEIENLGFYLLRADTPDGPRVRLNGTLIPGQGTGEGADYTWLDETAPDAAVFYWLEDIDWSFVSTFHGPVEAAAASAEEGGARIIRMEFGNPLVLWSRGEPGATAWLERTQRLTPGEIEWVPVPSALTEVYGELYRSTVPLPQDEASGFLRVLFGTE